MEGPTRASQLSKKPPSLQGGVSQTSNMPKEGLPKEAGLRKNFQCGPGPMPSRSIHRADRPTGMVTICNKRQHIRPSTGTVYELAKHWKQPKCISTLQ